MECIGEFEAATSTTTCFEHSAGKRKLRAKYRSPNRKRYAATG